MKGLILTYLITYASALGALVYPLIGLYVYVGFAILRPQAIFSFAGDLSGISVIVGYATLIGWALRGFGSWRLGRAKSLVVVFLIFVGWFLLSATQALDTTASFQSVVNFAKLFLPFLVGVTMLKGEKEWRPLLWTIVLAQGYVGFENNLNYLKGFNTAAEGFGGMDNNFFGVSLVSVLGPGIALILSSKNWFARGLAAVATALILHTTMLTYSRGAMLGLLAVGFAAFAVMPKRPKYIGVLLLILLVAARFTGPQLAARYSTTFASEKDRDGSAESRVELWADCLKVIEAYPIFGVGPANWGIVAAQYGWPPGKSAHSVWLETAAETGVPGVFALLLFFGWTAVKMWPIARGKEGPSNHYEVAVATGVILSIVGFAVGGQFVSAPGLEPPYYVALLGVALLKSRSAVALAPTAATAKPMSAKPAALSQFPEVRPLPLRR